MHPESLLTNPTNLFLRLPLVLKYICCEYQKNKTAIILLFFSQLNPSLEARSMSEIPFLQIPMSSIDLIPLVWQNVPYELLIHITAHESSCQYLIQKQRSYLLYVINPCAHQQLLLCNSANDSQSKAIKVFCATYSCIKEKKAARVDQKSPVGHLKYYCSTIFQLLYDTSTQTEVNDHPQNVN